MPTQQQLSRLFAIANKARLDNAAVHNEIASRYGIHSIPTLLLFKGGELADRVIGAVPKQMIEDALKKLL